MSPNTNDATQAALGIQRETAKTVLLDDGFGLQDAKFGHMAKLYYVTCSADHPTRAADCN